MTAGDQVRGITAAVAAGSRMTIKPTGTIQWTIHNIYVPAGVTAEMYITDGTNEILIDSTTGGGWLHFYFHSQLAQWIEVKNTSIGAVNLGYDGIETRT